MLSEVCLSLILKGPYNRRNLLSSSILLDPLKIDVRDTPWQIPSNIRASLQGIISINMIHIAPWQCTESLFKESSKILKERRFLLLYGPFKIENKHTSESNKLFDKSLKNQNNDWGVRNLENVNEEAMINGFNKEQIIEMPSNNIILIYRKVSL